MRPGLALIAIRNITQRPLRALASFIGIAAVSGALFGITAVYSATLRSIELGRARMGAEAMAVPAGFASETEGIIIAGRPSEFYMKSSSAGDIMNIRGVKEAAPQLFIISAPLACCTVSDTMLIGFEPERDFTVGPWLRQRPEGPIKKDEIIAGADISSEPGGRMKFYGSEFRMAGKLERTGMRFIDGSVFMPIASARKMIEASDALAMKTLKIAPDEISTLMLRFDEDADPSETALRIEFSHPEIKVILASELMRSARKNLLTPLKSIIFAGVFQWAAALFMIGVINYITLEDRSPEFGLMAAMGATSSHILRMLIIEIALLFGLSALAGIGAGYVLVMSFRNMITASLEVPFLMPEPATLGAYALMTALLAMASGMAVTALPALAASRKQPFNSIRRK